MVFRKKIKRARRYVAKAVRRGAKHISSNPMNMILPAAAYGAARGYLSNLATPITSKIPLGNYADEALFGSLGYYIAKKNPMGLKNVGTAMLIVESASLGSQLIGNIGSPSASAAAANNIWGV